MAGAGLRIEQWQLLRRLSVREQAAGELADALGRRISSVSRGLRILERDGVVSLRAGADHAGPGQPLGHWMLTNEGRAALDSSPHPPAEEAPSTAPTVEEAADEDGEFGHRRGPWPLDRHQSFVAVPVKSQDLPALLRVISGGDQAVEASFVVRLDGEVHTYLFVFDKRLGGRPAEVLASALDAAALSFSVGTIGDVRSFDAVLRDAKAADAAAAVLPRSRPGR